MASELLLALVAIATAAGAYWLFPDATESLFRRIQTARKIIFGIVAAIVAIYLLSTGSTLALVAGFLGLIYAVLWVVYERPDRLVLNRL